MTQELTAEQLQDVVRAARKLAIRAHAGQYDKAGYPYIEHLERVALAVRHNPIAMAVAWVHDLIEDKPEFREELNTLPRAVVFRAELMTRHPDVPEDEYYAAIKEDEITCEVKVADVRDNRSEHRLAQLPDDVAARLRKKYDKALAVLTS